MVFLDCAFVWSKLVLKPPATVAPSVLVPGCELEGNLVLKLSLVAASLLVPSCKMEGNLVLKLSLAAASVLVPSCKAGRNLMFNFLLAAASLLVPSCEVGRNLALNVFAAAASVLVPLVCNVGGNLAGKKSTVGVSSVLVLDGNVGRNLVLKLSAVGSSAQLLDCSFGQSSPSQLSTEESSDLIRQSCDVGRSGRGFVGLVKNLGMAFWFSRSFNHFNLLEQASRNEWLTFLCASVYEAKQ